MASHPFTGVELYWLPLGAGGHSVSLLGEDGRELVRLAAL
jgi:hypothetical protein